MLTSIKWQLKVCAFFSEIPSNDPNCCIIITAIIVVIVNNIYCSENPFVLQNLGKFWKKIAMHSFVFLNL